MIDYLLREDAYASEKLAICADPATPWQKLRLIFRFLEISFHGVPWLLFTVIAIFRASSIYSASFNINLLLALVLDLFVSLVVKMSVRRPRPKYHCSQDFLMTVKIDNQFSFPSGHTTRAIMCACILLYGLESSSLCQLLVLLWSVTTAVSRIMLGRHYITDVLAGTVIGILQFIALINYLRIDDDTCWSIAKWSQSLLFGDTMTQRPDL